jgi:cytochrome b561
VSAYDGAATDPETAMQPVDTTATRYDGRTMLLHWLTAILVATQWLGAQTIDWFPRGPLRVDARSVHITMGVLLAVVLVARILWRLTEGRRLPLADKGALNVVAKGTHWVLYLLLIAMVTAGIALTWARGDSLFNVVSIPSFAPGDKPLTEQIFEIHSTIAWIILGLVGLHAGAALVHRYLWHDGVLARMLPGRQRGIRPGRLARSEVPHS